MMVLTRRRQRVSPARNDLAGALGCTGRGRRSRTAPAATRGCRRDASERSPRCTRTPPVARGDQPLVLAGLLAVAAVALSGCSAEVQRGWLPGSSDAEITNQTGRITNLWVGSWIAALIVGLITWGLILWCVAVYRKRKGDDTLPVQLRYHVPLELMYVILPIIMVGVLFYYTNRDTTRDRGHLRRGRTSTCRSSASSGAGTSTTSTTTRTTPVSTRRTSAPPAPVCSADQVTLYLPVDERVEFTLDSRDVIHSFWIPAFLYQDGHDPGQDEHVPGHPAPRRATTWASAPSSAASTTRRCCSTSRSCRARSTTRTSRSCKAKGQEGSLGLEYSRQQDLRPARGAGG